MKQVQRQVIQSDDEDEGIAVDDEAEEAEYDPNKKLRILALQR